MNTALLSPTGHSLVACYILFLALEPMCAWYWKAGNTRLPMLLAWVTHSNCSWSFPLLVALSPCARACVSPTVLANALLTPSPLSCSLQRVVLELCGNGVPHGSPGSPESPEYDPGSRAASSVHSGTLQGVSPGHHPD